MSTYVTSLPKVVDKKTKQNTALGYKKISHIVSVFTDGERPFKKKKKTKMEEVIPASPNSCLRFTAFRNILKVKAVQMQTTTTTKKKL